MIDSIYEKLQNQREEVIKAFHAATATIENHDFDAQSVGYAICRFHFFRDAPPFDWVECALLQKLISKDLSDAGCVVERCNIRYDDTVGELIYEIDLKIPLEWKVDDEKLGRDTVLRLMKMFGSLKGKH